VLLLGDSQMFGYGVAYAESTAAELERRLPRVVVLDAAMPSWGPAEYRLALEEIGPAYRPRHVLFVANAANDWFETVSNARRTTARDGWAARAGAPAGRAFPGRAALLGSSHLVFAIRRVAHYVGDAELGTTDSAFLLGRDISPLRHAERARASRIFEALSGVAAACRKLGCKVVAAALPLDVQVDAAEWQKYRTAPRDLSDTEPLLEDFLEGARALGAGTVNLLPVLRRAQPGAFLDDDYHLSPRGHRAVAEAMAGAMRGSS
jgi:hypothetical protein